MDPDIEQNKEAAAVSYFWILSVVIYFAKKNHSAFIRFHARQAMLLFMLSIVFWYIPYIGRYLELIILAGAVYGFLGAYQGQWRKIPLIGFITKDHDQKTV